MAENDGNLDRFGWGSGQLSYIDDNGNKVRIGEISPEDQKMIDKLKAERAGDVAKPPAKPRRSTGFKVHIHRG